MQAARTCGVLHLELRERSELHAPGNARGACDSLTAALGFRVLGEAWAEVQHGEARQIIQRILWRDLAYFSEIREPATADAFASDFLDLFDVDARFFTNDEFMHHQVFLRENGYAQGWPVTEETCETGIVAVDARTVGMIWVEDQD